MLKAFAQHILRLLSGEPYTTLESTSERLGAVGMWNGMV